MNADAVVTFGAHARAMSVLLNGPGLIQAIGAPLAQEFRYAIASFRSRFPEAFLAPEQGDSDEQDEDEFIAAADFVAAFFEADHSAPETPEHPLPAAYTERPSMDYQQVHGFTAVGSERFATFLYDHGKPGLNVEAYRLNCLGSIETALNNDAPLEWILSPMASKFGRPETFIADHDDIIVETVVIGHQE